jgi:hypothetical protein
MKWDWNSEEKEHLEVITINGRIILKCILKKWFWDMWTVFGCEWDRWWSVLKWVFCVTVSNWQVAVWLITESHTKAQFSCCFCLFTSCLSTVCHCLQCAHRTQCSAIQCGQTAATAAVWSYLHILYSPYMCAFSSPTFRKYSGPSSYDRPDIWTTWVTTKILVLSYDQSWVTTRRPVKAKTCIRFCGCKQRPEMCS